MIALLMLLAGVDKSTASFCQQIPKAGIAVAERDREELQRGLDLIAKNAEPDAAIVHKAVDWALRYNEILDAKDVAAAKALLKGEAPKPGLAFHAYRSKIDGSLQPYGMVIPSSWKPGDKRKRRLDLWFHGRDEKLTELRFLSARRTSAGEFQPADAFVLHVYGRYCNASKFAGEVDAFEALEDAKKRYPIDEDRILVRGFSMGGASAWHIGAHHAGLWAAVAPGAGFAETPVYARMFNDPVKPTDYEQKLWRWYNATDYAVNLTNTAVIAYSGELDKQKQAADVMIAAAKEEGFDIPHLIGPKTAHKYEPKTREDLNRRLDEIAARGRDPLPDRVRFTTWTLRYNRMKWVVVDALERHWERARVDAAFKDGTVTATTSNVGAIRFERPGVSRAVLDGQSIAGAEFRKVGGRWEPGKLDGLRKRPGLQGPIDDAFMDAFTAIAPGGPGLNAEVNAWATRQFKAAAESWRRTMRGEFPVAARPEAGKNLILFGDPKSNPLIAQAMERAGFAWDEGGLKMAGKTWPADRYVPVFIYPDGDRYVVVNSGFTWAENAAASNSRHIPLLPDWAVIDIQAPPDARMSQRVAAAGFFDERWKP